MQAIIKKEYSKGFLLNEENLIKLADICHKRFKELNLEQKVLYKVYRSDSLVFDSETYQTLLDEENSKRNKIEKVRITSMSEQLKFTLSFDYEEGVSLSVEAETKDMAYLLFSDIKDYLTTEILCFRSFSFNKILSHKNIFPIIMLAVMSIFIMAIESRQLTSVEIQALLDTGTIDEKLNYLIESRKNSEGSETVLPMLGIVFGVFMLIFFIGPSLDKFYPRNIFCWGKMSSNYFNLTALRGKIVWGVVIAFTMSVLASLFINYISVTT
jgi:hypothetical protein